MQSSSYFPSFVANILTDPCLRIFGDYILAPPSVWWKGWEWLEVTDNEAILLKKMIRIEVLLKWQHLYQH
jgi:predicted alpha/beta superfamily hydrolase